MNNTAVVRLKKNNDLYRHIGGTKYINIRTGVEWEIEDDKAKKIFNLNLDATGILNKHPNVEKFINLLNLKIEI